MPLLTRLYDPDAFGLYAIIISLASGIGAIAPIKLDTAAAISNAATEARSLWQASLIATLIVLTLLYIVWLLSPSWLMLLHVDPSGLTWPFILAAAGCIAVVQVNTAWLLHTHSYLSIGAAKLIRGAGFVALAILFYDMGASLRGLAFAFLAAALIAMLFSLVAAIGSGLRLVGLGSVHRAVKANSEFPLKTALPAALDLFALILPLLAMSRMYSLTDAAMFGLFRQSIVAPLSLIAAAFGQVLMRQLSALLSAGEPIRRLVLNMAGGLALLSAGASLVVLVKGQELFTVIYGTKWAAAGTIAALLIVPACLQFLASTLSSALISLRRLSWLAYWQICYFLVICLWIGSAPSTSREFIYGLAVIDLVMSLVYLAAIWRAVVISDAQHAR